MEINKQRQVQAAEHTAKTEQDYTWSTTRIAEGVMINVVTFLFIALLGLFGGMIYAAWLLVLNLLHTPSGLIGILAFILLGAVLMLIALVAALILWLRGTRSRVAAGMVIGALIGASMDFRSGKRRDWDIDTAVAKAAVKVREQAKTTKAAQTTADERTG